MFFTLLKWQVWVMFPFNHFLTPNVGIYQNEMAHILKLMKSLILHRKLMNIHSCFYWNYSFCSIRPRQNPLTIPHPVWEWSVKKGLRFGRVKTLGIKCLIWVWSSYSPRKKFKSDVDIYTNPWAARILFPNVSPKI